MTGGHRIGLLLAAVAAGGLALAAWLVLRPQPVDTVRPTRGPAVSAVYATGVVEPSVRVPIAPRTGGHLIAVEVEEGDRVQAGQLLARLEDEDLLRSVDELAAREEYARQSYERLAELVRRGAASADERDRAEADWHAARAATERAREMLAYMRLRAPADGLIVRRDGEVGEYIGADQPIFYLATDAPLRVAAEVDEEDIPRVALEQRVLVRADAFPETVFEGRVDEITPMGDPLSRSYRVRVRLIDPPPVMIGMTADTNIIVKQHDDALLVPASALDDGHVWLVRDGRLHRQAVKVGIRGNERVEIVEGLAGGEEVVPQYEGAKEGARVIARSAQAQ